ncbi:hypothetical protein [Salinisphaera orenii]|uniref:hypothetical protein n=1 Tax=Salinisphaera orenii TaxID=856731 RepID=UPI000F4BDA4F|nr:hypothetical protein [Salinisphaera orenii]
MRARTGLNTALTAALILGATGLSAPAFAHGDKGAHVDAFETHLDDYEQEIEQLVATVDSIASDYAGDGVASEQLGQRADALVDDWEHVDFHEALETHAISLYPPIWVALGGLEEAIHKDGAEAEVRQWQQRTEAALWQGMGALKYAAQQRDTAAADADTTTEKATPASGPETIDIIQKRLDEVLAAYREGDGQRATTLVNEAYMQRFEGVEGALIERDADLVSSLEKDFNATLPLLIERGADSKAVADRIAAMNDDLDTARELLKEAETDKSDVF